MKYLGVWSPGLRNLIELIDLIKHNLCQRIAQFYERKITPVKFYSILLNEIHPFYYGNDRTLKILFANDDKINKLIDGTKIKKLII